MSISRKITEGAGSGGGTGDTYVDDVFSTYLYEGNLGNPNTITNGIDLAGEGGLVWIKSRSGSYNHGLIDTVRGRASELHSNTSGAEDVVTSADKGVTSFNSDGFTLGTDEFTVMNAGGSTYTYSSWTFRKAPKFFDVVTYTGDGVAGREIKHNLGVEPGMVIVKSTTRDDFWAVYHRGFNGGTNPEQYRMTLNTTVPEAKSSVFWNDTAPTSTVFTVGAEGMVNSGSDEYVAYVFAHDDSEEGMIVWRCCLQARLQAVPAYCP